MNQTLNQLLCAAAACPPPSMLQGEAELSPFDPFVPQPKMIHKGGYQPRYFVMDSFEVRLACGSLKEAWYASVSATF